LRVPLLHFIFVQVTDFAQKEVFSALRHSA